VPLYEYQCPQCGRFELIRRFSDAALSSCPTCGKEVQKLLSAPAIQFKGTGWYITDYARKGSGEGASKGSPSSSEGGAKAPATATPAASKDGAAGGSGSTK
jgi:putative FmdB family regulatory protein